MVTKCVNPVVDPTAVAVLDNLSLDINDLVEIDDTAPPSSTHFVEDGGIRYLMDDDGVWHEWISKRMDWMVCDPIVGSRSLQDIRAIVNLYRLQPSLHVKRFEMSSNVFRDSKPKFFTELNAPDWLTSVNTIKGSTIDNRWFWNDHILKLGIGEYKDTDFQRITRIG